MFNGSPHLSVDPPPFRCWIRTPHTPRVWPMRVAAPVDPGPDEASSEMAMIFLLQPDTLSAARETQQGNESRKHN